MVSTVSRGSSSFKKDTYSRLDVGFAKNVIPDVGFVCTILVDSCGIGKARGEMSALVILRFQPRLTLIDNVKVL